jgi:SAM-dependent methyltransferase
MTSERPKETRDVDDPVAKYNTAYSSLKDFVQEPNAFLASCLERIAKDGAPPNSRAMDVGVGQGRNAVLLARMGYDTVGIDRSDVGVEAVRRSAAALGSKLRAEVADATTYDFGRDRWDLITLFYYPLPILLIDRVKAAVRSGGHIVIERFTQNAKDAVGPDSEEGKLPNPMLRCFQDWNVLHYEHDVFQSDWHWNGESPTGPIVRLLARKP